eukprot:10274904-Lingulodinium_polyedra.AAC.1
MVESTASLRNVRKCNARSNRLRNTTTACTSHARALHAHTETGDSRAAVTAYGRFKPHYCA